MGEYTAEGGAALVAACTAAAAHPEITPMPRPRCVTPMPSKSFISGTARSRYAMTVSPTPAFCPSVKPRRSRTPTAPRRRGDASDPLGPGRLSDPAGRVVAASSREPPDWWCELLRQEVRMTR